MSEGRRGRCVCYCGVDVVRLPLVLAATSGVLGRHLHDDEREPVWVVDGHLDQSPGFLLGLGVYHNALLGEALAGCTDVADLQHQADRPRRGFRALS